MQIIGLDVSTSVIGIAVINDQEPDAVGSNIILLTHVLASKYKDLYDKALAFERECLNLKTNLGLTQPLIVIEDPLMKFQQGMSSASTIARLNQFNGMASFIAFDVFGVKPDHLSATRARKLANVVIDRNKGQHKVQVFEHMCKNDLQSVQWERKKNGDIIDAAYDMNDAYVVARGAAVAVVRGEPFVLEKKKKPLNKRPKKV